MKSRHLFQINRPLIPLKIINFVWVGGVYCMIPFLTIQMKDLGLSVSQTAIIYAITPIVGFFSSSIIGIIADKVGDFKIILTILLPLGGICFSFLLLIPSSFKTTFKFSDFKMLFFCNSSQHDIAYHHYQNMCSECHAAFQSHLLQLELHNCTLFNNFTKRTFEICYKINTTQQCQLFTSDIPKSFLITNVTLKNGNYLNSESYHIDSFSTKYNSHLHNNIFCNNRYDEQIIKCDVSILNDSPCTCNEGNIELTFWLYVCLRMTANIFTQMTFSTLNSLMVVMTQQFKGDFGKERIWNVLGIGFVSPLCGLVMDYVNIGRTKVLYTPPFIIFLIASFISLIPVRLLKKVNVPPPVNIFKTGGKVLKDFKTNAFLFTMLLLGSYWGFLETLLYWFLNDLKSPKWLFGIIGPVRHLPSIPGLMLSKMITECLGNVNIVLLTYIFYGVRLVGYSYIFYAEWTLLFDVMVVFTEHLMWVAASKHATKIAPEGMVSTLQGILIGIHYGLGQCIGNLVGGLMMSKYGARWTLRIMGTSAFSLGLIYFSIYFLYIKKFKYSIKKKDGENPETKLQFLPKRLSDSLIEDKINNIDAVKRLNSSPKNCNSKINNIIETAV